MKKRIAVISIRNVCIRTYEYVQIPVRAIEVEHKKKKRSFQSEKKLQLIFVTALVNVNKIVVLFFVRKLSRVNVSVIRHNIWKAIYKKVLQFANCQIYVKK